LLWIQRIIYILFKKEGSTGINEELDYANEQRGSDDKCTVNHIKANFFFNLHTPSSSHYADPLSTINSSIQSYTGNGTF
jgi:hypothetical protein